MSEAQAFVTLQSFLEGCTISQYNAMVDMPLSTELGVTCRPEAVQYLFTNYAWAKSNTKAVKDLRDTKQKWEEDEMQSSCRMNGALSNCGNALSSEEEINMYIDRLIPVIISLIQRFRKTY